MRSLHQEDNVEVLRAFAIWAMDEAKKAREELAKEREKKFKEEQLKLKFEEQLMSLRLMIFGRQTKRRRSDRPRDRDKQDEFDNVLIHSKTLLPPVEEEQLVEVTKEMIYHPITQADLEEESKSRGIAEFKPEDWAEIPGLFDESKEITIIERMVKEIIHRRKKYRYVGSHPQGKELIITAPGPEKLIPGATYSIDFAVNTIIDKYLYHTPLERQCRQLEALGLKQIQPKTLYNLCLISSVYLEKIVERIKYEVLHDHGVAVHCDDTTWPINNSKQDDGYMWVVSNRSGAYYRFEPTKSGKIMAETLGGFKGAMLTDGAQCYDRFKDKDGVVIGNCWAHVFRKVRECAPNAPELCEEIMGLIDDLSDIERKAKTFEELSRLRAKESAPIVDKLFALFENMKQMARSESGLELTANYVLKRRQEFMNFLTDPRLPMTNNDVERTIRQAVMGRKNFQGSRTHNGADVAAIMYTIIETCKRHELDPKDYINTVIRRQVRGESPPTPLEYAKSLRVKPEQAPTPSSITV